MHQGRLEELGEHGKELGRLLHVFFTPATYGDTYRYVVIPCT